MTTIQTTRIYRLRDDLPHDEAVAARCAGLEAGKLYWLDGSRPSSLGGYIGQFRGTYAHGWHRSPNWSSFPNIPMRYVEEVYSWEKGETE